jgi:hypothetical protein
MCLERITHRIESPTDDIITVWKLFDVIRNRLQGYYRQEIYDGKIGVWIESYEKELDAYQSYDGNLIYKSGFHGFVLEYGVLGSMYGISSVAIPVEFRKVTTYGIEIEDDEVVVAKEMRIPENWKEIAIPYEKLKARKDA